MLGAILKKEDCAACRFCCVFRRKSLWETPVFTPENIEAIRKDEALDEGVLQCIRSMDGETVPTGSDAGTASDSGTVYTEYAKYDLSDAYRTSDPEEEAPCPYLGEEGCRLNEEQKPWDCKIWPLRVMRKENGEIVIALTPTCPSVNKLDVADVGKHVNECLRESILDYADKHPYLIKEYKEGFIIL